MKKIFSVEQIREADAYTIKNEPIASIDLMERASVQCVKWLEVKIPKNSDIYMFCGPGNNGGDGLAISRLLIEKGYFVKSVVLRFTEKFSEDFKINYDRLLEQAKSPIIELSSIKDFPSIPENSFVIDAIFGSGLSKPLSGFVAEVVEKINTLKSIKIAIDIPSGLFADKPSFNKRSSIIKVDYTLTFQFPKLAFLFSENDSFVGNWVVLPIGLSPEYIYKTTVSNYIISKNDCADVLKKRAKFSHKGNYGHALLVAGSLGKMGAAVLAARACLRSGVGLLTAHIPLIGNEILQTAVPEAMLSLGRFENYFSDVPELSGFSAIGIGPGIRTEEQTQNSLKVLIQNSILPIVFDADALNILAENKTWLAFLPKGCIITPHPKEFERLAGKAANDFERAEMAKAFAVKHGLVVVLKGAYTQIATPRGDCFFNTSGNPGMATAGSGDVLTGIILGLLAQGYSSVHAAIIGAYIHGMAGDFAAKKIGQTSLIAGDLVNALGKAFTKLEKARLEN
jgi:NAD(P)H-hydrate epimerase